MAYIETTSAQTDAESPINVALMDQGQRLNIIDHETRILALEGAGGSGGGASLTAELYAEVDARDRNEITNIAHSWQRTISPIFGTAFKGDDVPGSDPEGLHKNDRGIRISDNFASTSSGNTANDNLWSGHSLDVKKGATVTFKSKIGENFFHLVSDTGSGSDSLTILVDGVAMNDSSVALVDEQGTAYGATVSTSTGTTTRGYTFQFYNLSEHAEQYISVENTDSASKSWFWEAVTVGYRKLDVALENKVQVYAGTAKVLGNPGVAFAETELEFTSSVAGGHTGIIAIDSSTGVLSAIDGQESAMTMLKAGDEHLFSGAVTTLNVKGASEFPDEGICRISNWYGQHFIFSYTSKTTTNPQSHSLNGVIWQSQPHEDFTPKSGVGTEVAGDLYGDMLISYWAKPKITISSANNKLDFKVVENGAAATTHQATLNSGAYSGTSTLMDLGTEIARAMAAANPIQDGEYYANFNEISQKWSIGVRSHEVTELQLLASSGAGVANGVWGDLGFDATDVTGKISFVANDEKMSGATRVHLPGLYEPAFGNKTKHSQNSSGDPYVYQIGAEQLLMTEKLDIDQGVPLASGGVVKIYTDPNANGMDVWLWTRYDARNIMVSIDGRGWHYGCQAEYPIDHTSGPGGQLICMFVSFPRGSKVIEIQPYKGVEGNAVDTSPGISYQGARQYYSAPPVADLNNMQGILETIDIAPKRLFETKYSAQTAFYSPAGSLDNINSIAESGTWGAGAGNGVAGGSRATSTNGGYVEIDFTLAGDGGGIYLRGQLNTVRTKKCSLFVSSVAIVEGTDLVDTARQDHVTGTESVNYDCDFIGIEGMVAGTYKARFKNEEAASFDIDAIVIIDTVRPDPSSIVANITNTGQSLSTPMNVIKYGMGKNLVDRQDYTIDQDFYKMGRTVPIAMALNSPGWSAIGNNTNFQNDVKDTGRRWYAQHVNVTAAGDEYTGTTFCKSMSFLNRFTTSETGTFTPSIDGVNLSTVQHIAAVKGQSAPAHGAQEHSVFQDFTIAATMAGSTVSVSDTHGIKVGQKVIIEESGGVTNVASVLSIVTDTSFDVKNVGSITAGNVTGVNFSGYHTHRMDLTTVSGGGHPSALVIEPMELTYSDIKRFVLSNTKTEVVSLTFQGVVDGDSLFFPTFSDGSQANINNSVVTVIKNDASGSSNFKYDLQRNGILNIQFATTEVADIKITSIKDIVVLPEVEKF